MKIYKFFKNNFKDIKLKINQVYRQSKLKNKNF